MKLLASLAAKMRLRADATSETGEIVEQLAPRGGRAGQSGGRRHGGDTALTERSVSGLTMTRGVFALVALCSFAFGFAAV